MHARCEDAAAAHPKNHHHACLTLFEIARLHQQLFIAPLGIYGKLSLNKSKIRQVR